MTSTAHSLTQTLADLEADGATGTLSIGEPGDAIALHLVHGRLVLPQPTELDSATSERLYNHGFDAGDLAAASIAEVDRLSDAVAAAMSDDGVSWSFAAAEHQPAGSSPTSVFVTDARRRQAETERLAIQVPGDEAVPDRIRGAQTAGAHLSRLLGNVYAAVDGSRSLVDLGRDLHVSVATIRRAVFRLSALGLVRFDRGVAAVTEAAPGLSDADWAADTLAEAIEEPEPWIGYAKGGDQAPPKPTPTPERHSVVREAEAAEAVDLGTPPPPKIAPPNRQRPMDADEQRESLRQAAAWLADIDSDTEDPAPGPAPTPEPERGQGAEGETVAATEAPAGPREPSTPPPSIEDVSDFMRELSQLSRDDDQER